MRYPKANPRQQPSPWWYFGRAVYVSRHDYWKIFLGFLAIGIPFGLLGLFTSYSSFWTGAWVMAAIGFAMLLYSLIGLYRQYGYPSRQYFERLVAFAELDSASTIADIHIGTYRHAYQLAESLPNTEIVTIDCWEHEGPAPEKAIEDVRSLEPAPEGHSRIRALKTEKYVIPLADESCDAAVFGFGTHEIPDDGPRDAMFAEAKRIVKPGGVIALFEHGYDFHNYLIFGPVIEHVTKFDDWVACLEKHYGQVQTARTSHAVDMFSAKRS